MDPVFINEKFFHVITHFVVLSAILFLKINITCDKLATTWPLLFTKRHLPCNLLLSDHVTMEQLEALVGSIFWAVFPILGVL